jgi:hypothetical protein
MATKSTKSSPTIALTGSLPKLTLTMPLDAKKIKAIQRCIAKGALTVTVNKVDLANGRLGSSYIYD